MGRLGFVTLVVLALVLAGSLVACDEAEVTSSTVTTTAVLSQDAGNADGYVALVPSVLRSGETASFSFTLTDGDRPGIGTAGVSVMNKGEVVAEGAAEIVDTGTVEFKLP
ncbi:MAG: hypothetical protein JW990_15935, partial [Thermoleophilia bacterium]|nr:hypothetical protein [Thermoleophilia bacterium]